MCAINCINIILHEKKQLDFIKLQTFIKKIQFDCNINK